jgi:CelD/BcsL family acetyltransferase involved in cellulose biosynthesis
LDRRFPASDIVAAAQQFSWCDAAWRANLNYSLTLKVHEIIAEIAECANAFLSPNFAVKRPAIRAFRGFLGAQSCDLAWMSFACGASG